VRYLALLLFLAACGTGGRGTPNTVTVVVESWNWDATAVELRCDDHAKLGIVRGVIMGSTERKRIPLMGCTIVYPVVHMRGGLRVAMPDRWVQVDIGHSVCVVLPPQGVYAHTTAINCTRYSE